MANYASMSMEELENEYNAWDRVIRSSMGPGWPSNSTREAAQHHCIEILAWVERRKFETDNPELSER